MTFAQADNLCTEIISLMLDCGRNYTNDRMGELQHIVLVALATGQFVLRYKDGELSYFACWWYVPDELLDGVLDFECRCIPSDITTGNNLYVAEAASRHGDARQMVKRIVRNTEPRGGKRYWHKPHHGGKIFTQGENNGRRKQ